jgi:hypothetical protein
MWLMKLDLAYEEGFDGTRRRSTGGSHALLEGGKKIRGHRIYVF